MRPKLTTGQLWRLVHMMTNILKYFILLYFKTNNYEKAGRKPIVFMIT